MENVRVLLSKEIKHCPSEIQLFACKVVRKAFLLSVLVFLRVCVCFGWRAHPSSLSSSCHTPVTPAASLTACGLLLPASRVGLRAMPVAPHVGSVRRWSVADSLRWASLLRVNGWLLCRSLSWGNAALLLCVVLDRIWGLVAGHT